MKMKQEFNHKLEIKENGKKIYEIHLKDSFEDLLESMEFLNLPARKVCIVTESNVAPIYLREIYIRISEKASTVITFSFAAGEANKQLSTIEQIYEHLIKHHFDRKDLLVALGGGVVGDMTGFAAATYLRGIDFIQIPTTLLAQVDSSIGGKTGVDFLRYKNMVGAFHQPLLVYLNVSTLKTLSDLEFACGMGEIIKHGLIRSLEYSQWLTEHSKEILERKEDICQSMIYQSCMIKKTVVENDPTEKGERAVLNMGHTVGHAVEKLKNFSMAHGQCVAVGCMASAYISMERGWITREEYDKVAEQLKLFGLPLNINGLSAEDILTATKSDKKMDKGHIKFVLMKKPGNAVVDTSVTDQELLEAIESIRIENQEVL